MTEDTNKSQHILYLQNIEKHIHWSGLLNHIEKTILIQLCFIYQRIIVVQINRKF